MSCPAHSDPASGQVVHPASVRIVLPARNEAENLQQLLPRLAGIVPGAEVLVVDDGSTDTTLAVCRAHGRAPCPTRTASEMVLRLPGC